MKPSPCSSSATARNLGRKDFWKMKFITQRVKGTIRNRASFTSTELFQTLHTDKNTLLCIICTYTCLKVHVQCHPEKTICILKPKVTPSWDIQTYTRESVPKLISIPIKEQFCILNIRVTAFPSTPTRVSSTSNQTSVPTLFKHLAFYAGKWQIWTGFGQSVVTLLADCCDKEHV